MNLDWGKCRFLKSSPWVLETRRNTSFSIVKVRECDVESRKGILCHVELSYISCWKSEISVSPESSNQPQMAEFWHLYRMWAWIKGSIPWSWCYFTEWLTVYHTYNYTYNVHHTTYVILLSWCWVIWGSFFFQQYQTKATNFLKTGNSNIHLFRGVWRSGKSDVHAAATRAEKGCFSV